MESHLKHESEK